MFKQLYRKYNIEYVIIKTKQKKKLSVWDQLL